MLGLNNWMNFFFAKERVVSQESTSPVENSINNLSANIGRVKIAKSMLNNLTIEHYSQLFNHLIIINITTNKSDIEYLILSPFFEKIKEKQTPPFYYPDITPDFSKIEWKKL